MKDDCVEKGCDEFFMITSFTCKSSKHERVPEVVHADHTLRPHEAIRRFYDNGLDVLVLDNFVLDKEWLC